MQMNAKLQLNLNHLLLPLSFFLSFFFFSAGKRKIQQTLNAGGENQSFRFELILN